MQVATKREYKDREDYTLRLLAKIPRTYSEKVWEEKNPGYELQARTHWNQLNPGDKVWRGYEGEKPSTFISYEKREIWNEVIREYDEAHHGIQEQERTHSTQWNTRFARVIVKVG